MAKTLMDLHSIEKIWMMQTTLHICITIQNMDLTAYSIQVVIKMLGIIVETVIIRGFISWDTVYPCS